MINPIAWTGPMPLPNPVTAIATITATLKLRPTILNLNGIAAILQTRCSEPDSLRPLSRTIKTMNITNQGRKTENSASVGNSSRTSC